MDRWPPVAFFPNDQRRALDPTRVHYIPQSIQLPPLPSPPTFTLALTLALTLVLALALTLVLVVLTFALAPCQRRPLSIVKRPRDQPR